MPGRKIKKKTAKKKISRKKINKKSARPSKNKTLEAALSFAEKKLKRDKKTKRIKIKDKNKKYYLKIKKVIGSLKTGKIKPLSGPGHGKLSVKTGGGIKIIKNNPYLHKKSPYVINLKRAACLPQIQAESIKYVKPLISKNLVQINSFHPVHREAEKMKLSRPRKGGVFNLAFVSLARKCKQVFISLTRSQIKKSEVGTPKSKSLAPLKLFFGKIKKPALSLPRFQVNKSSLLRELFIINILQVVGIIIASIFIGIWQAIKIIISWAKRTVLFFIRPSLIEAGLGYFKIVFFFLRIAGEIVVAPLAFVGWLVRQANNRILALEIVPPDGWGRKLLSFCLIGIIIVLPLRGIAYYKDIQETRGEILNTGADAFNYLGTAASLGFSNPVEANKSFGEALTRFQSIRQQLGGVNTALVKIAATLPDNNKLSSGSKMLLAGENVAQAGKIFTNVFASLEENQNHHLTKKLDVLRQALLKAQPFIQEAGVNLTAVNPEIVPPDYRIIFLQIQKQLPLLTENINGFVKFSDALLSILGHEETKRYLIFFQNNAELRPTGGFLGSFALLDIDRGEIKNLEIPAGGTYDMNGSLKAAVIAPEPLHLINTRWQLQDANWFADFPASAEKIMWFYEKSGGPTVDGVITITPTVVEKLLKLIGPITLENYGTTINEANFWRIVQKEAEKKFYETRESKQIIGELADKMLERILSGNQDKFIQVLQVMNESLQEKDILLYFTDKENQEIAASLGWSGEIKAAPRDYLAVINTNIAGGKSDRVIKENISLQTEILPNGEIINTAKIIRTHQGQEGEEFIGVNNISYLRLYVPSGSALLNVEGANKPEERLFEEPEEDLDVDFQLADVKKIVDSKSGTEVYEESGKTVFANWLQVKPGHSRSISFTYKLPFKLNLEENEKSIWSKFLNDSSTKHSYSLLIQKQPGTDSEFGHHVKLPDGLKMFWKYPHEITIAGAQNDSWNFSVNLNTDRVVAFILQR